MIGIAFMKPYVKLRKAVPRVAKTSVEGFSSVRLSWTLDAPASLKILVHEALIY